MPIRLTLPYPPSANRYWRQVNGHLTISKVAKVYKQTIADLCTASNIQPAEGTIRIDIDLYRPQKTGDLDNFLKVLIDSLAGFCYHNDKQIISLHANRYEDPRNPRAEVLIRVLTEPAPRRVPDV